MPSWWLCFGGLAFPLALVFNALTAADSLPIPATNGVRNWLWPDWRGMCRRSCGNSDGLFAGSLSQQLAADGWRRRAVRPHDPALLLPLTDLTIHLIITSLIFIFILPFPVLKGTVSSQQELGTNSGWFC